MLNPTSQESLASDLLRSLAWLERPYEHPPQRALLNQLWTEVKRTLDLIPVERRLANARMARLAVSCQVIGRHTWQADLDVAIMASQREAAELLQGLLRSIAGHKGARRAAATRARQQLEQQMLGRYITAGTNPPVCGSQARSGYTIAVEVDPDDHALSGIEVVWDYAYEGASLHARGWVKHPDIITVSEPMPIPHWAQTRVQADTERDRRQLEKILAAGWKHTRRDGLDRYEAPTGFVTYYLWQAHDTHLADTQATAT